MPQLSAYSNEMTARTPPTLLPPSNPLRAPIPRHLPNIQIPPRHQNRLSLPHLSRGARRRLQLLPPHQAHCLPPRIPHLRNLQDSHTHPSHLRIRRHPRPNRLRNLLPQLPPNPAIRRHQARRRTSTPAILHHQSARRRHREPSIRRCRRLHLHRCQSRDVRHGFYFLVKNRVRKCGDRR